LGMARRALHTSKVSGSARFFRMFLAVLVVGFVLLLGNWLAKPYLFCRQQTRQIAQLEAQAERISARNKEMRAEIERLETSEGVKGEARRQGWIEPGETPMLVPGVTEKDKSRE
jgi:cell division protein FtsB